MPVMARLRENRQHHSALIGVCLALSLGLTQGCARSEPMHRAELGSVASEQRPPFPPDADHAPASDGSHSAIPPDPKLASGLPFRAGAQPRILPAGTLLTVQLAGSLSTASVRAGDVFTASVAAPLVIDGETLIDRGTAVSGRVESAQSQAHRPGLVQGSGYFRLTLSAITVGDRQLLLQTSSLFARGTLQHASSHGGPLGLPSDGVRVPKGRRLTFRLTAPVTLETNSVANREPRGPVTE